MFEFIAILAIGFSVLWLHSDFRRRVTPRTSLVVSALLMVLIGAVTWAIAAVIPVVKVFAPLIGGGCTVAFSTFIARPVSTKLRLKAGSPK